MLFPPTCSIVIGAEDIGKLGPTATERRTCPVGGSMSPKVYYPVTNATAKEEEDLPIVCIDCLSFSDTICSFTSKHVGCGGRHRAQRSVDSEPGEEWSTEQAEGSKDIVGFQHFHRYC